MKRLIVCMLFLGIGFASALTAAEARAPRATGDWLNQAAPQRSEACQNTAPMSVAAREQKIWPFCFDISCAVGGDAGCALYCIVTGTNSPGGYCVAGCCHCVEDEPPMMD
jgi:hypothetical protein